MGICLQLNLLPLNLMGAELDVYAFIVFSVDLRSCIAALRSKSIKG